MSEAAFFKIRLRVWWSRWSGMCWLLLLSAAMFMSGYSVNTFVTRERLHTTLVESALQVEEANAQAEEAVHTSAFEAKRSSGPRQ